MQVQKMSFSTNNTNAIATKATLFYTKRSNEFSASETYKVGETAITTDAFEITLNTPATLTEGDNRFWLCYDISEEAQNGQTVDAALISVTANVNGAEKTENATNGNPDGHRTVQNTVLSYADMGTLTKTISGTCASKPKKAAARTTARAVATSASTFLCQSTLAWYAKSISRSLKCNMHQPHTA